VNEARRADGLCERTRAYVSLEIDGELSEFEREFLTTHLVRCSDCRAYRANVDAVTREIRETPLEVPTRRVSISVPAAPRRRRVAHLARYPLGAAAAFAVALVGTATLVGPSIDRGITNGGETFPTQLQETGARSAELLKPGRISPPNAYAIRAGLDYIR
jgi:predicted anti-sigma-YlaC factor YlaD